MLYREIIAVCSQTHTKHINPVYKPRDTSSTGLSRARSPLSPAVMNACFVSAAQSATTVSPDIISLLIFTMPTRCVLCSTLQQYHSPHITFFTSQRSYVQPTFTRRTSELCLGTFRAVDLVPSPAFSPSTSVFPCQYQSTNAHIHVCTTIIRRISRRSLSLRNRSPLDSKVP